MNLVEYIFRAVREQDRWSQTAIVCEHRRLSYAALWDEVRRFAGLLQQLNVGTGERVALVARDCPEYVSAFLGTTAAGAVAVPVSTMLPADELAYVLEHSGTSAVVLTADQLEKLSGIRPGLAQLRHCLLVDDAADNTLELRALLAAAPAVEIAPVAADALAFLLYTSGSTGRPKGVMHTHRNLPYTVETFGKQVLQIQPDDRVFSSSRLFFAYGLGNSLSFPLGTGATGILCPARPTPQVIADVFTQHRPTIFLAVPAVFRALLEYRRTGQPLDTGTIRFCVSAGEKLPAGLYHEWQETTGLAILDGIGSTEMLHMFFSNRREQIVPGSSGRLVPGYEAKLRDDAGREIDSAGIGDLFIKGGSASPGYWRDEAKTAATMQNGWVRTGDIYRRDADGNYWFEGRSDDLFKVKGLWVSPGEVEDVLLLSTAVAEAAVVAGLNEDGMTAAVAYLVLKDVQGDDADTVERLRALAAARLPSFKCPAQFYLVAALPRTATGKLQRYKLRAQT